MLWWREHTMYSGWRWGFTESWARLYFLCFKEKHIVFTLLYGLKSTGTAQLMFFTIILTVSVYQQFERLASGVTHRYSLFGMMAFPVHWCCGSVVVGLSSGTHLLLLLPWMQEEIPKEVHMNCQAEQTCKSLHYDKLLHSTQVRACIHP